MRVDLSRALACRASAIARAPRHGGDQATDDRIRRQAGERLGSSLARRSTPGQKARRIEAIACIAIESNFAKRRVTGMLTAALRRKPLSTRRNIDDAFVPGDLVLFAGQGLESRTIAAVTCSPLQLLSGQWFSHIGICALDLRGRVLIFESTTLCDSPCEILRRTNQGTQAHRPGNRIKNYAGKVWRLRLSPREALAEPASQRLSEFLLSEIGKPYDYAGAMISGTWRLRFASWFYPTMDRLFCSYYVMAALKDVGKVDKDLNPRSYHPARVARDLQVWGTYQPLGLSGSESFRIK